MMKARAWSKTVRVTKFRTFLYKIPYPSGGRSFAKFNLFFVPSFSLDFVAKENYGWKSEREVLHAEEKRKEKKAQMKESLMN